MKSKKEIKKELKKRIDEIEDENLLNELKEDIAPYAIKNGPPKTEEEDDLSDEQLAELDQAFKEMEAGEYVTMDEFRKVMRRWLTE